MKFTPRTLSLLTLSLSLSGCAGINLNPLQWFGGDEEVNPPAELMEISSEVRLSRIWSVDVGNGQGDNYTEITPVIEGNRIYAASENGSVLAVDLDSGDVIWRTCSRFAATATCLAPLATALLPSHCFS